MKVAIYITMLSIYLAMTSLTITAQNKRYTKVPGGYLMVLRQHDSLFQQLEILAKAENIPAAHFTGLGFLSYLQFGFFNFQTKQYEPKVFNDVELASLTGSIAWQDGKISLHAHGVAGNQQFNAFAGHILKAVVGTGSVEIMVMVLDKKLERKMDESIGANVLQIE